MLHMNAFIRLFILQNVHLYNVFQQSGESKTNKPKSNLSTTHSPECVDRRVLQSYQANAARDTS